jgi:hypothetical protein
MRNRGANSGSGMSLDHIERYWVASRPLRVKVGVLQRVLIDLGAKVRVSLRGMSLRSE